ncbi:MAG TPA: PAS domain S-box protein [Flavitalea sp.]|nr:PAS domain S-box protein [Flavitalea sp.]
MSLKQPIDSLPFINVEHVLETLPYGLVVLGHDWTVHYWNKNAEKLTGIPVEAALHESVWTKYSKEENPEVWHACHSALSTGKPVQVEVFTKRKQNWTEISIYPCSRAITVYFRDITNLKQKEQHLAEVNERNELVAKATSEAIWDWSSGNTQFLWYGENFKKLFGYDVVNAYSDASLWEENVHPDQREAVVSRLWDVAYNGGEYWSDQYWFRKQCGEYVFVKDRAFIIRDKAGKPLRMIGSMDDITPQKLAEMALVESENNYRLLFEAAPEPQLIYDEETLEIITVNEAALNEYGYSREELKTMTVMDLRREPIMMKYLQYLNRKEKGKTIPMGLWKHRNNKGERFIVEVLATKINYSNRPCVLVNISNVTEKVKLETKLLKLQKLQQRRISRAMILGQEKQREELGKELHDNVNQLIASAKLLLQSAMDNPAKRTELVELSCHTLSSAINEIRGLTKSLMPSAIDYAGLAQSVVDLIEPYKASNKFAVSLQITGDEKTLSANTRLTLFRIIQEQLNNISKYAQAKQVNIRLQIKNQIELVIADDGIGFDTAAKRLGVGITNMQNRTTMHNGVFSLCSAPGEGCIIKVQIPNRKS